MLEKGKEDMKKCLMELLNLSRQLHLDQSAEIHEILERPSAEKFERTLRAIERKVNVLIRQPGSHVNHQAGDIHQKSEGERPQQDSGLLSDAQIMEKSEEGDPDIPSIR